MSNSSTTTEKWAPVPPGQVLLEDFIKGFGITQNKLAVSIGVPPRRINEIVHGSATYHGGHRPAPGALLRDEPAVLDQPAVPSRP